METLGINENKGFTDLNGWTTVRNWTTDQYLFLENSDFWEKGKFGKWQFRRCSIWKFRNLNPKWFMKRKPIKFQNYWSTKMNIHRWQRELFSIILDYLSISGAQIQTMDFSSKQIFDWKQFLKLETCCFCCIEYDCTFTVFGWLKKELQNIISVKELISLRLGLNGNW